MDRIIMYAVAIAIGLWLGRMLSSKKQRVRIKSFIQELDVETFASTMRKGQLIDLRKASAYEESHIKGARRFSVSFLKTKNQRLVRKDQPIYIYCETGRKAKKSASKLVRKGYRSVNVLIGGYRAYRDVKHR